MNTKSWRERHHYISDQYEDDLGAPSEDAYTADEKADRAIARFFLTLLLLALCVSLVLWIGITVLTDAVQRMKGMGVP